MAPLRSPAMITPASPCPPPHDINQDLERGTPSSGGSSSVDITALPSTSKNPFSSIQPLNIHEPPPAPSLVANSRTWFIDRVPAPLLQAGRKVKTWTKGPVPPRIHNIKPLFEHVQTWHNRQAARLPREVRGLVYMLACVLWVVLFGTVIRLGTAENYGAGGSEAPFKIGCVASMWPSPESCGLDGMDCLPFDKGTLAFNCPAGCAAAQVLNPRAVGGEVFNYRSLVIGGTPDAELGDAPVYRGDSFICSAAIHAGVITDEDGGCSLLSLSGERNSFGSVQRHGIESIEVNASFPMSYTFSPSTSACRDPRWNLLALSTVFTAAFGLFTTTAATFFAPTFTIIFFQIGMASDPPPYTDYASLASTTLGRFLPAALAMALMYRFSVRKTLHSCTASVEKTILWVGGCWVGALANYTFERIPLQRLTTHDLHQQPGAITSLVILVLVIFAIALYQAHTLRLESRLPRYLALYALFGTAILLALAAPNLTLRLHHYILALLFLPGTSLRTRPSLLVQGLLVGLFINGVARWGFDPMLQTSTALRGDAFVQSPLPEIRLDPTTSSNSSSIALSWAEPPQGFDDVSVLVNDVERFRGREGVFRWERKGDEELFFRFGFVAYHIAAGAVFGDYTRAGMWGDAGWSGIPEGRT